MGNSNLKELEIHIYKEILNWKYLPLKVRTKERRRKLQICRVVVYTLETLALLDDRAQGNGTPSVEI